MPAEIKEKFLIKIKMAEIDALYRFRHFAQDIETICVPIFFKSISTAVTKNLRLLCGFV